MLLFRGGKAEQIGNNLNRKHAHVSFESGEERASGCHQAYLTGPRMDRPSRDNQGQVF